MLYARCTYPRGKTAGYYGTENQKRRPTLTSKTQTIIFPRGKTTGELQVKHMDSIFDSTYQKVTMLVYILSYFITIIL